ncbi:MBL fold metallo-hydrolase [Salimicrobium halophilum]|uniref:Glyoxylase, beta-lactamase superfamily II n=1 Tax=Salimicrobium halophilum TaxID=86666 RepID=A0A1G8PXA7_9BACI|nr:MBL fold metallo-hydrolase [Salimicrobium halophilum]SDI96876.1 Glyoxylase, beta-lactamase superfamily II [Salimicrobium halophilum]
MKTLEDTVCMITVPTPYAVGDVHLYILKGKKITLIDAGVRTEEAWTAFHRQLKEYGMKPEDIQQVILTHHHPDHIGLVEYLPNVEMIAAHEKSLPWLIRDETFVSRYISFFKDFYLRNGVPEKLVEKLDRSPGKLKDFPFVRVTDTLEEGDVIPDHPEWSVIETPGHAQSHLSFFRKEDGSLIGGDHLLAHISPNPIIEPPFRSSERAEPMMQYRSSLKKLKHIGVRRVLPGHGNVFHNVKEVIDIRLRQQEERAEKVYRFIKEQPAHAFDISKELFPNQHIKQYALTMSETIGQLDYLRGESRIKMEVTGGQEIYYVN